VELISNHDSLKRVELEKGEVGVCWSKLSRPSHYILPQW